MRWVYAQIVVLLLSVLPWSAPPSGRAAEGLGWSAPRQTPALVEARPLVVEAQPSARLDPALPWTPPRDLAPQLVIVACLGAFAPGFSRPRSLIAFRRLQMDGP